MCTATTTPGTTCNKALRDVSLLLGGDPDLPKCFKRQCSSDDTTVKCNCQFSSGCGKNVRTIGGNIITIGPGGSECPNGKLGSYAETAFHETLHSGCGLGAAEPDNPDRSNQYAAVFRHLEKKCYGWKAPGL
jgi:hypothetical protein